MHKTIILRLNLCFPSQRKPTFLLEQSIENSKYEKLLCSLFIFVYLSAEMNSLDSMEKQPKHNERHQHHPHANNNKAQLKSLLLT